MKLIPSTPKSHIEPIHHEHLHVGPIPIYAGEDLTPPIRGQDMGSLNPEGQGAPVNQPSWLWRGR